MTQAMKQWLILISIDYVAVPLVHINFMCTH